ncbi:MAG: bifunctional DNA-formamidopyrimidine glycosylase/DNA-(apurinic or apyrimidinic site) lyase [bacterium]
MPELPEVEIIRKQLAKELVGSVIVGVEARREKCYEGSKELKGERIVEMGRVGKYLFVYFESGRGLMIHLKMTGRLVINNLWYETADHTRVIIKLADGRKIYYWDTRMFGYIKVVDSVQLAVGSLKQKMGPGPWEITDIELLRRLQKTKRSIKESILDQNLLAGVGNIYANDGLWESGIDPRRPANSLGVKEVKKLRDSLCRVLERGLTLGGASDNTFRDAYGGQGSYQKEFLVYGRTGEPCNKCGMPLRRIVVGGRGTWVCTNCQK